MNRPSRLRRRQQGFGLAQVSLESGIIPGTSREQLTEIVEGIPGGLGFTAAVAGHGQEGYHDGVARIRLEQSRAPL